MSGAGTAARVGGGEPGHDAGVRRVALLGNPNTGKTTLFNRLSGLRHKTSNFPGTTQDARVGFVRAGAATVELIDLPGVYSLELDQHEADLCRRVLAGAVAPAGERAAAPDAVCVVVDSTNLARNLVLVGEVLRRRLPTVVVLNMIDLARRRGLHIDAARLGERLGCAVVAASARSGEGVGEIGSLLMGAIVPNRTPPGTREGLEAWSEEAYAEAATGHGHVEVFKADGSVVEADRHGDVSRPGPAMAVAVAPRTWTDRLDHVFTHPVLGLVSFAAIMTGLFWMIFSLATVPMNLIEAVFAGNDAWAAPWQPGWLRALAGGGLTGLVNAALPEGLVREFLADGVVGGVGSTVVFLPQICILFFLISLLEDTGYLARAAFVMDRVLRPFGLPGHAFVPLLSSHACALPGIMAARGIPDRRDRLATILVAPFMSCSARIPVYVLLTVLLFPDSPWRQALAFTGCYALGIAAGLVSALIARRTILRGSGRPMALELPTYKAPSLRTALMAAYDRGVVFIRKAGTNILLVCIVLWWLGAFPKVAPPPEAVAYQRLAESVLPDGAVEINGVAWAYEDLSQEARRLEAAHARRESFIGKIGRGVQPAFAPLGFDWQLTVGVMASFAAREVFVSTMSVIVTGEESAEAGADAGLRDRIAAATRDDGRTPVFTRATSWSLLVFFVLAMQCLPTLVVSAREAGGVKWALLQFAWMSALAYLAALGVYQAMA